jgi:hypothetical protein
MTPTAGFVPNIDISHRDLFDRYRDRHPTVLSDQTFTNLFIWQDSRHIELIEEGRTLIVVQHFNHSTQLFGDPMGPLDIESAARTVKRLTGKPVTAAVRLRESSEQKSLPSGWEQEEDRNNFDYVYRQENLSELAGRKYHKKRNLIAQCLTENTCAYEAISPDNLDEVREMMDRWCASRNCGETPGLCHEYLAIQKLLTHFNALDVFGGAIRIGGRIEAFTIGERLNANTAVVHIEKAMGEFKGLYQLINNWFCQHSLADYEFVNREQDLGIEGLRQAKESYFPDHLIRKCRMTTPEAKHVLDETPAVRRCMDGFE